MKNTIAGASFVIASAICVLAFGVIPYEIMTRHPGGAIIPFAWLLYLGLGLYFLLPKDKPPPPPKWRPPKLRNDNKDS